MTARRQELLTLTDQLVDAFNRMDLDDVVAFFSEDGVYEDSTGGRHIGHAAIRAAFEPLVGGSRGKIHFDGEDGFAETDSGKVLASWRLTLDRDGEISVIRGIDILEFKEDKLKKKQPKTMINKHPKAGTCYGAKAMKTFQTNQGRPDMSMQHLVRHSSIGK